jgi:hydrogenase expression/formation protein HypC
MCLSIPSKVVSIDKEKNIATVDTMGVKRDASLELMEEDSIEIDDYVLLHVGFVMNKIDKAEAIESLKLYQQILSSMDEQEREDTILQSDECENR